MASLRARGRPPHEDVLTPAEWRLVNAVRHGMTNPPIAERQGVSTDTVKYHVANALQKLGFSSRIDLRPWDGVSRQRRLFNKEVSLDQDFALGALGQIARSVPAHLARHRRSPRSSLICAHWLAMCSSRTILTWSGTRGSIQPLS